MNWLGAAIVLWLIAGLDWGLRSSLELGETGVVPSLLAVLLTHVCLRAPANAALAMAAVVGLIVDLLRNVALEGREETTVIVGPAVVGAMFAAAFLINLRGLLYRRNIAAVALLSGVTALMMSLAAALLLAIRSRIDGVVSPPSQFVAALGSAVYTVPAGILLAPVLAACSGFMGLRAAQRSRFQIN